MLSNYPGVRTVIYVVGIVAQVASFFAPVFLPELAQPLSQTADFLGVVAIGTAVSNVKTPAQKIAAPSDGSAHVQWLEERNKPAGDHEA